MKHAFLAFAFFISFSSTNAQQYEKIVLDSGCVWQVRFYNQDIPGYVSAYKYWKLGGDTLINGTHYFKLANYQRFVDALNQTDQTNKMGFEGFIRQNTVQGKIYFLQGSSINEELLHSFNKDVGDSLDSISRYMPFPQVVNSIRFDSFNGVNTIRTLDLGIDELYDGIGSNHGFIEGLQEPIGWGHSLDCFGRIGYWPFGDSTSCKGFLTGLKEKNATQNRIIMYPNPTTANIFINNQQLKGAAIQLFNSMGQLVHKITVPAQTIASLNISDYPRGMYLLRAQVGFEIQIEKMLKQ